MKKVIRIVVILLIVAAIGVGAYLIFGKKNDNTEKVYVESVKMITGYGGTNGGVYAGVVEAQEMSKYYRDETKTIDECFVEVGDEVKVGDKLFSYNVEALQLQYEQLQLDLESVKSKIETMKTQLAQLEKEKKRASSGEKASYTIQIQTLELNIKQEEYSLKKKEAECEKAKNDVSNNIVYSEANGTVRSINESSSSQGGFEYPMYEYGYGGEQNNNAYITIMTAGDYTVKGKVSEQNVNSLYEGMEVTVKSRVDESTWHGMISSIVLDQTDDEGYEKYYDGSSQTATKYPFYVTLDSSEGLMIGQHVYICLGADAGISGLFLPQFYIVFDGDDAFVYVANKKDKIEKRRVTLGEYNEQLNSYAIESGLTETDYIAYPALENVKEGTGVIYNQENQYDIEDLGNPEFTEANAIALGE